MPRHRGHDQKLRLIDALGKIRSGEMKEVAERPAPDDLLEDRIDGAVDGKVVEAKGRLPIPTRHALEQLGAG